jgi:hypothetical protein
MNDDLKLTPHITRDQWCELNYRLSSRNCREYFYPLLRLFKRVVFTDEATEAMGRAVYNELPNVAWVSNNWEEWACKHSRWVDETPNERLIWVEGIWCGTGLSARIGKPYAGKDLFQIAVTDDDDWIVQSEIYETIEAARVMLSRIERCNTLLELHSILTGNPIQKACESRGSGKHLRSLEDVVNDFPSIFIE